MVNHGGVVSGVGSRVEMFDVVPPSSSSNSNNDEEGEGLLLPSLVWRMAIGGDQRFGNMVLNSVVEGRGDEVFITQVGV